MLENFAKNLRRIFEVDAPACSHCEKLQKDLEKSRRFGMQQFERTQKELVDAINFITDYALTEKLDSETVATLGIVGRHLQFAKHVGWTASAKGEVLQDKWKLLTKKVAQLRLEEGKKDLPPLVFG